MKTKQLLFIGIFTIVSNSFSQQIWKESAANLNAKIIENPKRYKVLTLDKKKFLSIVKGVSSRTSSKKKTSTILLPVDDRGFETFDILEASNFSQELAAKFPEIKSYVAKSSTTNKVARLSYSEHNGLRAFIETNKGTVLIKPANLKSNSYVAFNKKSSELTSGFECALAEKVHQTLNSPNSKAKTPTLEEGYLKKYRLALTTTGEYSNFFLTGNEKTDTERKAVVLAALNMTLTRINGILERDLRITLELIPDNDKIIHLDAATDPFGVIRSGTTNGTLNEVQSHLDEVIGNENYDLGELLARRFRNYGYAYPSTVCVEGFKGSTFSSGPNLDSEDFYMVFAHELGHQLGTDHTQSSSNCRPNYDLNSAVEPGSGSTIMGYAGTGLCSYEVQDYIDGYYNYANIDEIKKSSWIRDCGEFIYTGNRAPRVSAGNDYNIPKSTPFILEGTADDVDNNSELSYCWEQNDPENPKSLLSPQSNWSQGPLFRSQLPTDSPIRYMPRIEDVIKGDLTPTWEVVPSVSRTMDFALTVRDNAVYGPETGSDVMTVTVDGNSGPFVVTSQQSNTTWEVGDINTVTWDVANTNQAPINATTVAISLSIDGGYTYPVTLATGVPNTGRYDVVVPQISEPTQTARLMIRAENNIFYAINASDFSIDLNDDITDKLTGTLDDGLVHLNWEAFDTPLNSPIHYNVYRNDELIATVTETTYSELLTVFGSYKYKIVAVDNTNKEETSNTVILEFSSLSTLEVGINGFKYFPNPVNQTLIIEANEAITRIEIYNLIGHLISVEEHTFKKRTEIDLSHLSSGMYYIRSFSNEKKEVFNIMKK